MDAALSNYSVVWQQRHNALLNLIRFGTASVLKNTSYIQLISAIENKRKKEGQLL
jgi:hypothetical protein